MENFVKKLSNIETFDSKKADQIAYMAKAILGEDIPDGSVDGKALLEALSTLAGNETAIMRLHYGLETGYPLTLAAIADMYDVTTERIRQIREKAVRKLRHLSRTRKFYIPAREEAERMEAEKKAHPERFILIERLDLEDGIRYDLVQAGISYVTDLEEKSDAELLQIPGIDSMSLKKIRYKLEKYRGTYVVPEDLKWLDEIEIGLSERSLRVLERNGIQTVGELKRLTDRDLYSPKFICKSISNEIASKIRELKEG